MANDIAKLGFSADTSDLKKAKADLNAIVPPAEKVEKAAKKAGDALSGMGNKADAAAEGLRDVKTAAGAAAAGVSSQGTAADKAAGANQRAATGADNAARAIKKAGDEAVAASGKLARLGTAANDNLNAVQATPANIAAQFQDIGVTAAAGMNPMLIALQQGTQLSVAFSNGFTGIGAALKQIFSPIALTTIGMVAIVAALIQMVDWVSVGKAALYGLADALDAGAVYGVAFAAAMALINAPAIISGVVGITRAVWGLVAGMAAAIGLPAILVAGFIALVAAANVWRDDLTKKLGFDIVGVAKNAVNAIIGFFVGGYNGIVKSWGMIGPAIDDILAQAVQYSRNRIEEMINSAIDGINSLLDMLPDWMKIGSGRVARVQFAPIANPNAGAAAKVGGIISGEMKAAQGVDYVGSAVQYIENGAKYLSGKLRGIADGLGKDKDKKDKAAKAAKGGKTDAEKFTDIVNDADRRIATLEAESKMIGVYGEALYTAKAKQDMLTEASRKGLTLDKEQLAIIDQKAKKIGELTAANEKAAFMEDMRVSSMEQIEALKAEQAQLGLFGVDLRRAQIEYQLLAEARKKNIDLTPEEIQGIRDIAEERAQLEEKIRKQREAIEFDRTATRGFFRDLIQGARDGKSAWEAFSNAFNNLMDKIIDKLLNEVLDAIFQVNSAAGGGGGGILSTLGNLAGSVLGGGGFGSAGDINAGALASLRGTDFNPGVIRPYAKGDAFTNSIVKSPTAFAYGGGQLGVMGEAGDEAVMPLQRGPDGSLGVQMYGDMGQTPSTPAPGPITFDLRGAVMTEDLMNQMNQIAADRADVAVVRERTRNERLDQRRFKKK